MLKTYEAVPALEKVAHRVLVTFTSEATADTALCGAILSEMALSEDWAREEENVAWAHLRAAK